MKIAYLSPLSPSKSGIADFSEELIFELKKYMDIDLFYDEVPDNPNVFWNFLCYPIEEMERQDVREQYDLLVYHLGNNYEYHHKIMKYALKYPGVIELHDYSLAYPVLTLCGTQSKALECVAYCDGEEAKDKVKNYYEHGGEAPWVSDPFEIPLNRIFLEKAKGVIVHSLRNKNRVQKQKPGILVETIYLHSETLDDDSFMCMRTAREQLDLPKKQMIFGSFGYMTNAKRIHSVLVVLKKYREESGKSDFLYCIVGDISPDYNLIQDIENLGLKANVLVTGYTDLETFKLYMQACNFCINLRYPSFGETSASLHRMLGYGKVVLVTDHDTFSEYPDEFTVKIPYGEKEETVLYEKMKDLLSGEVDYEEKGRKAWKYAKNNYAIQQNAKKYAEFFGKVYNKTDTLKELYSFANEAGLRDGEYYNHLAGKLEGYLG